MRGSRGWAYTWVVAPRVVCGLGPMFFSVLMMYTVTFQGTEVVRRLNAEQRTIPKKGDDRKALAPTDDPNAAIVYRDTNI